MFNLSFHLLTLEEIALLNKGLNFAPTTQPNPFTLFEDLIKFVQNLTVKRFFNIKTNKNNPIASPEMDDNIKESTPDNSLDASCLAILEELYNDDDKASYTSRLTQHLPTTPPYNTLPFNQNLYSIPVM